MNWTNELHKAVLNKLTEVGHPLVLVDLLHWLRRDGWSIPEQSAFEPDLAKAGFVVRRYKYSSGVSQYSVAYVYHSDFSSVVDYLGEVHQVC